MQSGRVLTAGLPAIIPKHIGYIQPFKRGPHGLNIPATAVKVGIFIIYAVLAANNGYVITAAYHSAMGKMRYISRKVLMLNTFSLNSIGNMPKNGPTLSLPFCTVQFLNLKKNNYS